VTASASAKPHKHSLLLVDDEPEILYSLKGLLRREFNLFTAESGKEALQILQEHPIHVVMTDQRMPEMTGVELMGRVRNEHPDAIRIVFTGYADIKAVIEAINNGGLFRYITKPWDPDDLVATLREAAAEYDRHVERRVILRDLDHHLERGRQLAEQLANEGTPAANSAELAQFRQAAEQLLERIRNLSAT
jgi:response regulator RpfG family c-di-GMP phosphodiesterase